jgi:hypothetical protein
MQSYANLKRKGKRTRDDLLSPQYRIGTLSCSSHSSYKPASGCRISSSLNGTLCTLQQRGFGLAGCPRIWYPQALCPSHLAVAHLGPGELSYLGGWYPVKHRLECGLGAASWEKAERV